MGFADSRLGSIASRAVNVAKSYISNKERLGGETGYDWTTGLGSAMRTGSTILGKDYTNDPGYMAEQSASGFLSNFGPQGQLLAGLTSLSSTGLRALDLDALHVSKNVGDRAGMNTFERIGSNIGAGANNLFFGLGVPFTKKLDSLNISDDARRISGGYSDTFQDMLAYGEVDGGNALFGANKLKALGNKAIIGNDLMTSIGLDTEHRISSVPFNSSNIESRNYKKIYGMTGQNYGITTGKQGMKMLSHEELDRIYASRKQISDTSDDIQKFQNGGSILIPDGALHAHKHHMEDVNPELAEDLTKKGIPVVSTDENGEVTQVAEIERQEIIFEKSLTEQIEKLWKDGSEEAMIEAGKLIAETLMTNCDDNVNLVKEVE